MSMKKKYDTTPFMKKASFFTLGCRLNFAETGGLSDLCRNKGHEIVSFGEEADLTIINTCTVTDNADASCRNVIRKAIKASPNGKIAVVGCFAQMAHRTLATMEGVDLILGTAEKFKIFEYLEEITDREKTHSKAIVHIDKDTHFFPAATGLTGLEESQTRAFLKIQDGCNYVCSFCIIPFARGRSKAITLDQVKEQTESLLSKGFKEIVLTGVNIGEYEQTTGVKLSELVKILLSYPSLERLRLSSIEPNTVTQDLLETLAVSKKSMPHFHLPLQSGSNKILQIMKRKYT